MGFHCHFSRLALYPNLGVVLHVLVMCTVCNSMFTATEGRRKAAPGVYCMHICVDSENSWKTVSLMVISVILRTFCEWADFSCVEEACTDHTLCRRWWRSNEITRSALGIMLVFCPFQLNTMTWWWCNLWSSPNKTMQIVTVKWYSCFKSQWGLSASKLKLAVILVKQSNITWHMHEQ